MLRPIQGSTRGNGFVIPIEMDGHGDVLCFRAKTWARHKITETVLNNGTPPPPPLDPHPPPPPRLKRSPAFGIEAGGKGGVAEGVRCFEVRG